MPEESGTAAPETALNINDLAAPVRQDESKDESFADLKNAIANYVDLIEALEKDPQSLTEAQVENSFALLNEAHTTCIAASGLKMKPV